MYLLFSETSDVYSNFSALIAYLDPGSGSLILQIIIAAAAGVAYTLRTQIANFFRFISGKSRGNKTDENTDGESNK